MPGALCTLLCNLGMSQAYMEESKLLLWQLTCFIYGS